MKKAGFYIHIPFCRQACRYCDFHFAVSLSYKSEMVRALKKEIEIRKAGFKEYKFTSLYFGGGTPSILSIRELSELLNQVYNYYDFTEQPEITLEGNPDDLTADYVNGLISLGFNRLSIGIQSFHEKDLELMRRSHTSGQAIRAIDNAKAAGFHNLNIDLIYGLPGLNSRDWEKNLRKAFQMDIQHISAYHLTFEPGTVFDHWRKKGRLIPVEDEASLEQFSMLKQLSAENNFIHYEISNFAKEGYFSGHNSLYWKQVPYIGIGPSAHSFMNNERRWNISSNKAYIKNLLETGDNYYEKEILSKDDHYNEFILTSLRTCWGIDLNQLQERFGNNYVKYTNEIAGKFIKQGELKKTEEKIYLSDKGILISDFIMSELFRVR